MTTRILVFFSCLLASTTALSATIDDGLIAHYTFDDTLVDEISGDSGTAVGNVDFEAGVVGNAVNLDNSSSGSFFYTNEYVELPEVTLGSEFTISHWVRFDSHVLNFPGHPGATFSMGDGATNDSVFRVQLHRDGLIGASVSSFGPGGAVYGGGLSYGDSADINDGEFHHIAWTVEDQVLAQFVDGNLFESVSLSGPIDIGTVAAYVGIHTWNGGSSRSSRIDGAIDDLRIYDRALTDGEMLELSGVAPVPVPAPLLMLGMGLAGLVALRRQHT